MTCNGHQSSAIWATNKENTKLGCNEVSGSHDIMQYDMMTEDNQPTNQVLQSN